MKATKDELETLANEIEERIAIKNEPAANQFAKDGEDRYRFKIANSGVIFEINRLRRDAHELIGELCVKCSLSGAKTYDGALSIADFNLSSARARTDRARLLAGRAMADGLDWVGYVEEFCQRVLAAERRVSPRLIYAHSRDQILMMLSESRDWHFRIAMPRSYLGTAVQLNHTRLYTSPAVW
jgi:exoribonuclease II